MGLTIGLAILVMLALAGAFAVLLGWANVRWAVDVPLQLRQLTDAMPGANCGGCGYVGCADYAEAVFRGEAPAPVQVTGDLICKACSFDPSGPQIPVAVHRQTLLVQKPGCELRIRSDSGCCQTRYSAIAGHDHQRQDSLLFRRIAYLLAPTR